MAEVAMETCWVEKKKLRVGLQGSGRDMYANTSSYHEEVAGFPSHQELLCCLIGGGVGRLKQSALSEKEGGNPSVFQFRHI